MHLDKAEKKQTSFGDVASTSDVTETVQPVQGERNERSEPEDAQGDSEPRACDENEEPSASAGPDASTSTESMVAACKPHWNYRARWVLFYWLPLAGLIGMLVWLGSPHTSDSDPWYAVLAAGWNELNGPAFWVPALWAFWMPWFNGPTSPIRGMRRIVFRDFNENDVRPWAIPLMHGLVWSACVQIPGPAFVPGLAFVAAFLTYDIFLIRYDILQIYFKRMAADVSPLTVVFSGLTLWWAYLATGLSLSHHYTSNTPLSILASVVIIIAPIQLMLLLARSRPIHVKVRKVAVIGAGWTGVYAAKWLLQSGLEVRVFERKEHLGGLWKYDKNKPGGVCEETYASSSKFYMHAADFPMKTSVFPTHQEIYKFINDYADKFEVREHVSFNTSVKSVRKRGDEWIVTGETQDGEFTETFDAVVVASGFNEVPLGFTGRYEGFDGDVIHSSQYKNTDLLSQYKRIVVVGLGESGVDVAHEFARIRDNEVYVSGSSQWFAGRFMAGDFAADTLMAPGVRTLMAKSIDLERRGRGLIQQVIHIIWGDQGSSVKEWGVDVPWLHGFVTKSRAAVEDVHRRRITAKTRIVRCSGHTVEFDDGSTVEADLIVDCTGFAPTFPFLDKNYRFNDLYRLVFDRNDPTLSFAGTARPTLGSIPALAEMQSRWIAAVYSGRLPLPNQEEQELESYFTQRTHRRRFYTSAKRPNLVDHSFYADLLARDMHIHVPWGRALLTMPHRFQMLLLAPWMAFKYELRGPRRHEAVQNIHDSMPHAKMYYFFIKKRFLRIGGLVWAIQLGLLALVAVNVPLFVIYALVGVFATQWLAKELLAKRRDLLY